MVSVYSSMSQPLRLLAILAHPDDESLGFGGTLAKYAAEGVKVSLVTATRGQRGRYRGVREGPTYPGPDALGAIREAELRRAATRLGVSTVSVLDYYDSTLDQVAVDVIVPELAAQICEVKPQVIVTFGGDGIYGHPDHIAISQCATAATIQAAASHRVDKLYYMAWSEAMYAAYLEVFSGLGSIVDGVTRRPVAWPDWMLTTTIDASEHWQTVWAAVRCHESQITSYEHLETSSAAQHMALWGRQSFYRVFSRVNGGRAREDDLFAGLRIAGDA
jgi:LmbE family N-acetylglucosaminyl deacetylase